MEKLNLEKKWYTMILENGYEIFTSDISQENINRVKSRFHSNVLLIVRS